MHEDGIQYYDSSENRAKKKVTWTGLKLIFYLGALSFWIFFPQKKNNNRTHPVL